MQQLQSQTAQAHEKFLETQTLASMMEHTREFIYNIPDSGRIYAPIAVPPISQPESLSPAIVSKPFQTQVKPAATPETTESATYTAPMAMRSDTPKQPTPHQNTANTLAPSDMPPSATSLSAPALPIQQILFEIVGRLTGFPVEMLEPEMDIESDLGIDSIKKVEIISELEKQMPEGNGLSTDHMGSVKTLEDICCAIGPGAPAQDEMSVPGETPEDSSHSNASSSPDAPDTGKIFTVLVDAISELTGFPVEMLEPEMNLESDLGIDSIKRVEILSKLEQELDDINAISSEDMASLKNIQDIVQFLTPDSPGTSSIADSDGADSDGDRENNGKKKFNHFRG